MHNRMRRNIFLVVIVCALLLVSAAQPVLACTGIRLTADDGTVVCARTLEFGVDINSDVIVVPRGYTRTGTTPDGKPGLQWQAKYASMGANGMGMPVMIDGLNEKGLDVGLFFFPTTAGYMAYEPDNADKTIAPWEVGSWILDNFATVEEVKDNVKKIVVAGVVLESWGGLVPAAHYVVHDASGKSIVIEYIGGKLNIYDNPLGVMSNSPSFDWHMTNLRNYVNLSLTNVPSTELGSVTLTGFGQGTGMLGLPGDFTPPSRFVRAAVFSQSALSVETGEEAILQAFHILNNFDIPRGIAREQEKDEQGKIVADYTSWTSASDLKARCYYFRTYDNSQIRMADLMKMDLDAKDIVKFSMKGKEVIKPLNP